MAEPSSPVKEFVAAHFGVPTADLNISRLTGDASTRSYFRAHTAGETGSIVIAIYDAPFDDTRTAVERLRSLERKNPLAKLTFANDPCAHIEVTDLLVTVGLPVPKILGVLGAEGAMLFEDVGDSRLQDWLAGKSEDTVTAAYTQALEFIVTMQEATPEAWRSGSICSNLAFDEAKLSWELEFFFENYFLRYLEANLSESRTIALKGEFRDLCAELAARPRVLVHRDYHTRNLMMHENKIYIIDHQDARMGPASYDLASLLEDPYSKLDRVIVSGLIERFLELKTHSSEPIEDRSEFLTEYYKMTIQRMLKAIGTYSYQAAVMKNEAYVPYIEPALRSAVSALEVLSLYPIIRRAIEYSRARH
ncbi:MAG: hypothetical protein DMF61_05485 [Blastocatellia bacterium AA13]|nr:MAG: hypothetical protein DMF61_05485 [Blastocatellia bacterium AA13]